MQIMPIDITELVAIVLGISIVLVPVIGLTARFALKPAVEALSHIFESRNTNEAIEILERRVELQEQELTALRGALRSLVEKSDFDRQLTGGPSGAETRAPSGAGGGETPPSG